jgi:hypothetical protein
MSLRYESSCPGEARRRWRANHRCRRDRLEPPVLNGAMLDERVFDRPTSRRQRGWADEPDSVTCRGCITALSHRCPPAIGGNLRLIGLRRGPANMIEMASETTGRRGDPGAFPDRSGSTWQLAAVLASWLPKSPPILIRCRSSSAPLRFSARLRQRRASVNVRDPATRLLDHREEFSRGSPLLLGRGVLRIPEHCKLWIGVGWNGLRGPI